MEQSDEILTQIQQRISLKLSIKEKAAVCLDSATFDRCDGSIKKNTSFIKKLKQGVTVTNLVLLKKELMALKQEKYLEEVALSISEAQYKSLGDVLAAVEICALLDHRYPGFVTMLLPLVVKSIKTSSVSVLVSGGEKEEGARLIRAKSAMRMLVELNLVGLAPDGKQKIVPGILHGLLATDKELYNINLAVTFVKFYQVFYSSQVEEGEDEELAKKRDLLTTEQIRLDCQKVLITYYNSIINILLKEYDKIEKMEKSNQDSFIARGEITQDRQESYEKRSKSFEKLKGLATILAGYLHQEMPNLEKEEEVTRMTIGISDGRVGKEDKADGSLGIWEDEEAKSFYEKILDLANQVPLILLGGKSKSVLPIEEANDDAEGVNEDPEEVEVTEQDGAKVEDSPTVESEAPEEEILNPLGNTRLAFTGIAAKLLNALSRDTIDHIAVEFAFINNKGTRKQLVQTLLAVSRQRLDLLPYYSRLIATLNAYMPDIGTSVVEELESSFHYHQKKKEQVFIEEKLKNIRFIGELTKFRITPNHVVFHCLKLLLDNFNFHNVEIACSLLETCGRFLFFNPDTNIRTVNFLEILVRKKNVQNMDTKYAFMIDNACNPPEAVAVARKIRGPVEMYLRKIIYKDLNKDNVDNILKLLRKADWTDPLIVRTMEKLFFKISKIKFSNLNLMAFLASELAKYYSTFSVAVVDNTLEEIRSGMEKNLFKHNQRRIGYVKFLGELFNHRLVDSTTVFDTLYLLLRYGHVNGLPLPSTYCSMDAPNDFFRLRLACTLLDTCGFCFNRGHSAKKLDNYLMYIFTKNPIPIDAEFFVMETIDMLRPSMHIIPSYEESVSQLNLIAKSEIQEHSDGEDEMEGHQERRFIQRDEVVEVEHVDEVEGLEDEEDEKYEDEEVEDEDDDVVVHLTQPEPEPEEDEMFEIEFGRLMQESMESRRNERKAVIFDAPIPSRKQTADDEQVKDGEVAFTLLTKRGNKQQAKQMVLPASSSFAIHSLSKQQAEQIERSRLKTLVLGYAQVAQREAQAKKHAILNRRVIYGSKNGRGVVIEKPEVSEGEDDDE